MYLYVHACTTELPKLKNPSNPKPIYFWYYRVFPILKQPGDCTRES